MNLKVGEVYRFGDSVYMYQGCLAGGFLSVDIKLAVQYYACLIRQNEKISTLEWIKRIRRTYARSRKRNHLIKAIVNYSRTSKPKWMKDK